jgi:DNA-binding SARP family transcriptional activator
MTAQLEIVAHGVTAVLATWLGLIVLTRAGRRPGARLFATLAGLLVAWSVAIIVQRLTLHPETVIPPLNAIEDVAAYLLPVVTLHISLVLAVEGRRTALQQAVLVTAYAVSIVMAVGAVFFPEQQLRVTPPHLDLPGVPGEVLGWAWVAFRIAILVAAMYWIVQAMAKARDDEARRRQLVAAGATVLVGAIGGTLRFLPGPADNAPWLGVSFVALGVVFAAYAVFAQGIFLAPDVAGRAYRYSLVVGLGVTMYVGIIIGLERLSQEAFGIDAQIVTALALVATIALFDPIATWLRESLTSRTPNESARDRLRRALGSDLTAQPPETIVGPALARVSRTLGLSGAAVEDPRGEIVAEHGNPRRDSPLALRLALRSGRQDLGWVVFGPKESELPFVSSEVGLLSAAADFVAASLELGARHTAQAEALESLSADAAAFDAHGEALSEALVGATGASPGLRVFALGPLRVERGGELVEHWGGQKAGTRQAEAVFAFLFDRGERGAAKDEIVELIWPDTDLENADVAFHRTMNGLRTTLEPGRRSGDRGFAVTFSNDRYRLHPTVVAWSDLDAFDESMASAGAALSQADAIRHLERARALYRGEYLDDCPFYGDSAQVEERRGLLRRRCVDLLLALGERYERGGDRPAAAASFRQARSLYGEDLPSADEALLRLGVPV